MGFDVQPRCCIAQSGAAFQVSLVDASSLPERQLILRCDFVHYRWRRRDANMVVGSSLSAVERWLTHKYGVSHSMDGLQMR